MTKQRTGASRLQRTVIDQSIALSSLLAARERVESEDTDANRRLLHQAVDAAREAGIGWTKIGDTLGIASGNAYQRYRPRPNRSRGHARG